MEACGHTKSDWRHGGIRQRVKSSRGPDLCHKHWCIPICPRTRKHAHSYKSLHVHLCFSLPNMHTYTHCLSLHLFSPLTAHSRCEGECDRAGLGGLGRDHPQSLEQHFYCFKSVLSFGTDLENLIGFSLWPFFFVFWYSTSAFWGVISFTVPGTE